MRSCLLPACLLPLFMATVVNPQFSPADRDANAAKPTWRSSAEAAGLGEDEARRLGRDKLLVTDESSLRVFTPYLNSPLPTFVTSDSLLNAYHVLYGDAVAREALRNGIDVDLAAAVERGGVREPGGVVVRRGGAHRREEFAHVVRHCGLRQGPPGSVTVSA